MNKQALFGRFVDDLLSEAYVRIGIDRPSNHDDILAFVINDINDSTTSDEFTSEDVLIGFRRFIEQAG